MHRIGYVLHVSITKNMILKAENIPRIGDEVTNEKLKPVGTVFAGFLGAVMFPVFIFIFMATVFGKIIKTVTKTSGRVIEIFGEFFVDVLLCLQDMIF